MKVYSPEENYRLRKIQMAAKIYKQTLNVEKVEFDPKISKTFKESYPQYTLPLLETESGKFVTGTNAILMHIAGESSFSNKV